MESLGNRHWICDPKKVTPPKKKDKQQFTVSANRLPNSKAAWLTEDYCKNMLKKMAYGRYSEGKNIFIYKYYISCLLVAPVNQNQNSFIQVDLNSTTIYIFLK